MNEEFEGTGTLEDDNVLSRKHYSKDVNKRIGKLTYQLRSTESSLQTAKQQNQELEQRLQRLERLNAGVDPELQALDTQRREALENSEVDKYLALDDAYKKAVLTQQNTQSEPHTENQIPFPYEYNQWSEDNASWMVNNPDKKRIHAAQTIFKHMVHAEGFTLDDEDTYAELDKRLATRFKQKASPPPPTGQPDRGAVYEAAEEGLSDAHRDLAESMGFDLNNPATRERLKHELNKIKRTNP